VRTDGELGWLVLSPSSNWVSWKRGVDHCWVASGAKEQFERRRRRKLAKADRNGPSVAKSKPPELMPVGVMVRLER
jgi:hypothetical protein